MENDMRKGMYIYLWMGHYVVQQKSIQLCKSNILQKKSKNKNTLARPHKIYSLYKGPCPVFAALPFEVIQYRIRALFLFCIESMAVSLKKLIKHLNGISSV